MKYLTNILITLKQRKIVDMQHLFISKCNRIVDGSDSFHEKPMLFFCTVFHKKPAYKKIVTL